MNDQKADETNEQTSSETNDPQLTEEIEALLPDIVSGGVLPAARSATRFSLVIGVALVTLGIFAVISPLFTGLATAVLLGILLISGGILESMFAFGAPSFGKGVLAFLFGGLTVVAGLILVAQPAEGLGVLTFLLAGYFIASGISDIILAFKLKPHHGWGWALFSGILSALLGILIVAGWPLTGTWAVGVYLGVRLFTRGWFLIALGTFGGDAIALYQNQRLGAIEEHLRSGLQALQTAQAAQVAHTLALLALAEEVGKKVSQDEVDPAVRKLHDLLGEARKEMERTAEAGAETWADAQKEANRIFGELQKNTGELIAGLQKELGIDPV
ncbi:MAG: HdeD family acid-resistance protein [Acidobacteriota bacterium]|nr:HdeD family acid-resistance protein [Acidobacteriota bacterium]